MTPETEAAAALRVDGRAQSIRIAAMMGWERAAHSYGHEGASFRDPRNAQLERVRCVGGAVVEAPTSFHLDGGACRALLRSALAIEEPRAEVVVAAYLDLDAERHRRCAAGDPRAGWAVRGNERVEQLLGL